MKKQTCKECVYRDGIHCVYNPPFIDPKYRIDLTQYPVVFMPAHTENPYMCPPYEVEDSYSKACSKFRKGEEASNYIPND